MLFLKKYVIIQRKRNGRELFFMKHIKKSVCILIIFIFVCGCASSAESLQENNLTTLTLFSDVTFWNFPEWSLDEDSITAEISEKTNVALDVSIPPQEADQKLSLLLHKGDLPDIMSLTDSVMIRQLIDSGKVWRLDEFLAQHCPDSHLLSDFPEDMKNEQIRQYGGWYAYPSNINSDDAREIWKEPTSYYGDLVRYRQNYGILWNRALLEQAGLSEDFLQTQSQVLSAFAKVKSMNLTVNGEEAIPLLFEGNAWQDSSLGYLMNSFGAECVDKDGNYTERWLQPEGKDVLKFVNTLFREGYSYAEHLAIDNVQVRALMTSGRVLCYMGNIANTSVRPSEYMTTGPLIPDNGNRPVLGIDLTTPTGWIQTFISKDCAHPKEAARFLDYMTGSEGLLLTQYGREGEDFYYDVNGLVRRTKAGQKKAKDHADHLTMFWNFYNSAWEHSHIPTPDPDSDEALMADMQSDFAKDRRTYVYDAGLLRLPDNYIPADSEMGIIENELALFRKEHIPKIISASTDDEFEKQYAYFIEHQKELGIDLLDQKIDEQMHKNFIYYKKVIEKVNTYEINEKIP